ncbi:sensor histidine kinase [Alkalihalobacillus pseudalcaliphilus]|uniref:sensor histidine kinase n=1 Tax=Alkalihalobacillus pseudalcaliphilus TaxID=79884 RepID=UPI00064DA77B|nr:HAMP domain-containing sensor histidine kinase [Alkalihalobacillus pseudalcaliphilus]KMK75491.1 hypothetical protein AB990_09320 [Alkalihalobacillus pseudalcaliphilus]
MKRFLDKLTTIQFKFVLLLLIALAFIPLSVPLVSMVVYFPGILLNYEETPYTGYRDLTEMWHEEASQLGNQEIEEINHRLKELSEHYHDSSIFWVDQEGQLQSTYNYDDHLPESWTPSYTVQFMKSSYDADPFTVVAFLGAESDQGFMVIQVSRDYLEPPIQRLSEHYEVIFGFVFLIVMSFFIFICFLFFRKVRNRLIDLGEAMSVQGEKGLPNKVEISNADEIGHLEKSFNEMIVELHRSKDRELEEEQLRKELIANLSHDLRTPLTIIRKQIGLLEKEKLTVQGEEALVAIDQKIDFLANLIDHLLSFSLLQSGRMTYKPQDVEMPRFLRKVIVSWYSLFEQQGFEIEFKIEGEQVSWYVDENWLERILDNLLQNVSRHANSGKYIKIELKHDQLLIEDKGKGLQHQSEQKGAGLGMVIVDLMVKEMGLKWEVYTSDKGTKIVIKS